MVLLPFMSGVKIEKEQGRYETNSVGKERREGGGTEGKEKKNKWTKEGGVKGVLGV